MNKHVTKLKKRLLNPQSIATGTLSIMFFTLISKALGFVREMVLAAKFGTSWRLDALIVAMDPALQIGSTVASAIATMMIPLYLSEKKKKDPELVKKYTTQILFLSSLLLLGLGLILTLFSNILIKIFAPNFSGDSAAYAIQKMRIMGFIPLIQGFNTIASSVLRAEKQFSLSSIIQLAFNLVAIPTLMLFSPILSEASYLLSFILGTLCMNTLYIFLIRRKFDFRYIRGSFKNKKVSETIHLSFPLLLSGSLSISYNIIDRAFASYLEPGSITTLRFAQTITSMINSIVIGSLLSTVFTELSEINNKSDKEGLKRRMTKTTNDLFNFAIPFTGWMIVMAQPLIRILLQRGNFDTTATINVSGALVGYMISFIILPQNILITKMTESARKTKITLYASLINILCNILFNSLLIGPLGTTGLALSSSLVAFIHYLFLVRIKKSFFNEKIVLIKPLLLNITVVLLCTFSAIFLNNVIPYITWLILFNLLFVGIFCLINRKLLLTLYQRVKSSSAKTKN